MRSYLDKNAGTEYKRKKEVQMFLDVDFMLRLTFDILLYKL